MYSLSDFDFHLPEHLIAQAPPEQRDGSRLLQVGQQGQLHDRDFASVLEQLRPGDALVMNDTKVLAARIAARKQTGGRCELLVERVLSEHTFLAQIKASHKPKVGDTVLVADQALLIDHYQSPFVVMKSFIPVLQLLQDHGTVPLPPYISRQASKLDDSRYQTVYAKNPGAIAAPTAGLHWTQSLLDAAVKKGVQLVPLTLHVGAGTFSPVRSEDLSTHTMHAEWYELTEQATSAILETKRRGGSIVSVGTTTLRALESAAASGTLQAGARETQIFITPGYQFKVVDALITNFHLPKSTLMMLVSAFAGYQTIARAYQHAIAQEYRFFSYGDAMWLERSP